MQRNAGKRPEKRAETAEKPGKRRGIEENRGRKQRKSPEKPGDREKTRAKARQPGKRRGIEEKRGRGHGSPEKARG